MYNDSLLNVVDYRRSVLNPSAVILYLIFRFCTNFPRQQRPLIIDVAFAIILSLSCQGQQLKGSCGWVTLVKVDYYDVDTFID